ncbi:MAG: adenosylmethionine--8-amino-7-oxononanoate transaminase [Planctomycetes bacterium]|nr:adenosylmethionine--8-amino-7-oxononanoate transaminase [Planctomycetota bacterium]
MRDWMADDNLIIERAEGNYLYDTDGRKYLDGVSSLWCNVHGHRKKQIDAAIKQQLDKMAHSTMLGLTHPPAIKLAEQLIKIAPPGLTRVFYSDNGSTAMEIALKMAFQYWQQTSDRRQATRKKTKFLTFVNAYHGDTIGSVSLGGIDLFHATYKPLLFETISAPAPYCYRCPDARNCELQCLAEMERLIEKHRNELAAVVIEPLMQGAAGMISQPRGFIRRIRQLCTTHNILMIVDEVATGFGRTGRMFAVEHENVVPDIMAVAKGITGGYLPLAATLTTEKVFNGFLGEYKDKKTFFHGHTYTGNPLACAAALASLKIFRDEKVLEKLQPKIAIMQSILKSFYKLNNIGDIRQTGFMAGIELVKNRWTRESYPYEARMGHKVILDARRPRHHGRDSAAAPHGVILRPLGDVIVLMPPLSITIRELIELLHSAYHAIESVGNHR